VGVGVDEAGEDDGTGGIEDFVETTFDALPSPTPSARSLRPLPPLLRGTSLGEGGNGAPPSSHPEKPKAGFSGAPASRETMGCFLQRRRLC